MEFKNLNIKEDLIKTLNKNGIKTPTKIQEKSIPYIQNNMDIIAEAQTGSGKTLSFLLPIINNLSNEDYIKCLILTPTRELAIQITNEALKLNENLSILSAYGGKDINSQIKKLKNNINIVIATPGRLIDHIMRKTIDLSKVETLILDEADEMLFMGFKNDIEKIMTFLPKKKQVLCFSATIDSKVKKLAYKYMTEPVIISTKEESIPINNITQEVFLTSDREKFASLCECLDKDNPFMAIIFCRTKVRVDKLEENLHKNGYNCAKIHSDIKQSKREKIMKSFRNADIQYLIATDVAARGIDVNGITHIYNYDIPENVESYIHRIGRCGRADEKGYTCLFVSPKDEAMLKQIEEKIDFKIPKRN